ncbi:TPA: hypothetical protein ACJ2XS_000693 [Pseudomonas aeruginosa]
MNKALDLLREIRPSIPKEVLELWCKDRDAFLASHPAVEQAGGNERAKFEYWASDEGIYPKAVERSGNCYKLAQTQSYWMAWQARAALAQPSPVPVSNIEFARKLFEEMALIADDEKCIRMLAGALTQSSPAHELDPLGLAPHAEAFNEAPDEALRPEQAEAERPEVFGLERYRVEKTGQGFWPYCVRAGDGTRELFAGHLKQCKRVAAQLATAFEDGKFVAGALRAENAKLSEALDRWPLIRDSLKLRLADALARVAALESKLAELEKQEPVAWGAFHFGGKRDGKLYTHCETEAQIEAYILDMHRSSDSLTLSKGPLYAAPVDQAQHSVPDGAADLCRFLAKLYCELDGLRYSTAKLPAEQIADALIFKWPVLQGARNQLNIKRISEQPYDESKLHSAIAAMLAAAPGKEVGHE